MKGLRVDKIMKATLFNGKNKSCIKKIVFNCLLHPRLPENFKNSILNTIIFLQNASPYIITKILRLNQANNSIRK